jgi:hypothetical protein
MLQTELKRVGCYDGPISGDWSPASRRALDAFNRNAGTKLDAKTASLDSLGAVRDLQKRVCPLECGRGLRPSGDQCVKIACDPGYVVGESGACELEQGSCSLGFATAASEARRPPRTAQARGSRPGGGVRPSNIRCSAASCVRPVRLPTRQERLFGQDIRLQRRNAANRSL